MSRQGLIGAAVALLVLAGIAAVALYFNRGAHMELVGEIKKVRTHDLDGTSSFVVVDFHVTNPSDFPFVVRQVEVSLFNGEKWVQGETVADVDARGLFEYYRSIGPKYNDTFKVRDQLPSKESGDRMVSARFELQESRVDLRKGLKVRITESASQVTELVEKR